MSSKMSNKNNQFDNQTLFLDRLPDDIISSIFDHIHDAYTILILSQLSEKFNKLLCNRCYIRNVDFDGKYNFSSRDFDLFISRSPRCTNITSLNIESVHWISSSVLANAICKLVNLKSLYTIDTDLRWPDVCVILTTLDKITQLSFLINSREEIGDLDENLQDVLGRLDWLNVYYEHCYITITRFPDLLKIFKHCHNLKSLWVVDSSVSGFKTDLDKWIKKINLNKLEMIRIGERNIKSNDRMETFEVFDLQDQSSLFASPEHLSSAIDMFLPSYDSSANSLYKLFRIFEEPLLRQMMSEPIEAGNVSSLNLLEVNYNYKDHIIGKNYESVKRLVLPSIALYDDLTKPSNKPVITTLTNACPLLEELIIERGESSDIFKQKHPDFRWYPDCLSHISTWVHLKKLALSHVCVSENGKFFVEMANSCTLLTTLYLQYLEPTGHSSEYIMHLCNALPSWKKLQSFKLEDNYIGNVTPVLTQLSKCTQLEIIEIKNPACKEDYELSSETLEQVIINCTLLQLFCVIDVGLFKYKSYTLEDSLVDRFSETRPSLVIRIDYRTTSCICSKCPRRIPYILQTHAKPNKIWTYSFSSDHV